MTEETPPAEASVEAKDENPTKRIVRRVVAAPTPAQLAERRAKRLHESQLENSRAIANELTVWDGDEDLEIPVRVETDFDGRLLAKYYRDNGWPHCLYAREVDPAPEGVPLPIAKLVFSVNDTVQVAAPAGDGNCELCGRVEHTAPCSPIDLSSGASKPAKKSTKRASPKT